MHVKKVIPTSRAMMRACLEPLYAGLYETQHDQLAHAEAQIAERARALDGNGQEGKKARATFQPDPEAFVLYDESAAFINYLDDQDLLRLRGARTAIGYYERRWPGKVKPSTVQFKKYLRINRFIPEGVVKAGHASASMLDDLVHVGNPSVIRLLCERIGPGLRAQRFRELVQAYGQAVRWGIPIRTMAAWSCRDEKEDGFLTVVKWPEVVQLLDMTAPLVPEQAARLLDVLVHHENWRRHAEEDWVYDEDEETGERKAPPEWLEAVYHDMLRNFPAEDDVRTIKAAFRDGAGIG